MTAPDPGLTDLIAAHRLWFNSRDGAGCYGCDWRSDVPPSEGLENLHHAHVALVVEQHTNGRIAEYIAQLESERETLTSMCSELESIRDEQAARIAELETLQRVDQDLFVQTLAIANQRKERAEKAEATVARVITALEAAEKSVPDDWGVTYIYTSQLRAALEGEQQ